MSLACHDCAAHAFRPHIPSPLSPRRASIHGPRPPLFAAMPDSIFMREQPKAASASVSADAKATLRQPKRGVRSAKVPKADELREKRRGLFLKKVKEGREEKRFGARGEDIMRLDFMQRQRAWEALQAREAPPIPSDPIEDEDEEATAYDLPSSTDGMQISAPPSQQPPIPDAEAEEAARREQEELDALLQYLPGEEPEMEAEMEADERDMRSEHFGSDDDEYEQLFEELMDSETGLPQYRQETASQRPQQQIPQPQSNGDEMMMDLS